MRQCSICTSDYHAFDTIVWSPDSQQIASTAMDDDSIQVWDPATGQCKKTLERSDIRSDSITWSPNSQQIFLMNPSQAMEIWDLVTEQCKALAGSENAYRATWSPDSKIVASSSRGCIKVWDAATGERRATLQSTTHSLHFVTSETLRTDAGVFNLLNESSMNLAPPHGHDVLQSQTLGYGFDETETWILYGEKRLLWLPVEYRPTASAINGTTIMIGCSSDRILLLKFLDNNVDR